MAETKAYVLMEVAPGHVRAVVAALREVPGLVSVDSIMGPPSKGGSPFMASIKVSVYIKAPAEKLFPYLTDFENMSEVFPAATVL